MKALREAMAEEIYLVVVCLVVVYLAVPVGCGLFGCGLFGCGLFGYGLFGCPVLGSENPKITLSKFVKNKLIKWLRRRACNNNY